MLMKIHNREYRSAIYSFLPVQLQLLKSHTKYNGIEYTLTSIDNTHPLVRFYLHCFTVSIISDKVTFII